MSVKTKGPALGDIVLYETPREICREEYEVTRVLTANCTPAMIEGGLRVGTPMDFDVAVQAVQTIAITGAPLVADGGTYRLGFRGRWTAPIDWDEVLANIKTAFELITPTEVVTFSAAFAHDTTCTFNVADGNVPEIMIDARLLTIAGVSMVGECTFVTTTVGELATMKLIAPTAAATDAILLEAVSAFDLQNASGEALRRSFIMRGHVVLNATKIAKEGRRHTAAYGTAAVTATALIALGLGARLEPFPTAEGTPNF